MLAPISPRSSCSELMALFRQGWASRIAIYLLGNGK
jgi:hypothetical protein